MPTLSEDFTAGIAALRNWFTDAAPDLVADAEPYIKAVETGAQTSVDAAVTTAAPTIAPEVVPVLNGLLDDADAAIDAKLAADIAALQETAAAAKAKNAATRTVVNTTSTAPAVAQ